ncbi:MAG: Nif11-like leader peptide family natural product precursor [Calothrix sp. MO_167.B12]|nr:Nif11-like leader peptide family natural product precursor [Calothrix sp. MO_167.B12]
MSNNIVEKVKDFLVRLVKDESFRTQLTNKKVEEVKKVLAENGYTFSQNEFEKAAIRILEFKELGEFHDLTEEELVGAVGGVSTQFNWRHWQDSIEITIDSDSDINPDIKDKYINQEIPYIDIIKTYPPIEAIAMYGAILPPEELISIETLSQDPVNLDVDAAVD